jgi:beta-aspartyl-peptidase (threonine type)
LEGTRRAAEIGAQVLKSGGDCQAAAVAAVRHMEDAPAFNAGKGACMSAGGGFEADAGLMRSRDMGIGAVASMPMLANAIDAATLVLESSRHHLLCGEAGAAWVRGRGVGMWGKDQVWTQKAEDRYEAAVAGRMDKDGRADTVGAVVLDARGDYCAAGSTGGVLLKTPGRVGDTPVPGAGFYATPELGACVATGMGEAMLREVTCVRLLERIARSSFSPERCAREYCEELRASTNAAVGVVGITARGVAFAAHDMCRHAWARWNAGGAGAVEGALSVPSGEDLTASADDA